VLTKQWLRSDNLNSVANGDKSALAVSADLLLDA